MLLNMRNGKIPLLLLVVLLTLDVACALEMKTANKSAKFTQSDVWYDGDREQRVWVNPQLVAEFNPGPQGEQSVKNAFPAARVMPTKHPQRGIRLWQMNNSAGAVVQSLKASNPQGKFSPVLHEGPSSGSRMRALPGNIIVHLDPQWSQGAANNWLQARQLEVVKKLEIGTNIYLIKTGPGLEALNTANALYRSGEVKAAYPDWWQEVSTR
ncbi:MAG TPA: hypothetical protein VGD24_02850 [Gallionella sp.]